MVKDVIILGHRTLLKGTEVIRANVEVIEMSPPPYLLKLFEVFFGMHVSTEVDIIFV